MQNISDQQQRQQALDTQQSFIVQAPAGSGKTELLMQRYLALLTTVSQPEEILAITFTRKAAAEMRNRILQALQTVSQPNKIAVTQQLAQQVLQKDQELRWEILKNPERLRIQTIDSFCNYLTQHMPILTELGSSPALSDDGTLDHYSLAAQRLFNTLETDEPWVPALKKLLLHLDNDFNKAEKLFVAMLRRRDQWLPHILSAKNLQEGRKILEQGLLQINLEVLTHCYEYFPQNQREEIITLARYAATQLKNQSISTDVSHCLELSQFPSAEIKNRAAWLGIATLLLRKEGGKYVWRKTVQQKQGFPAASHNDYCKSMKQRMLALLAQLNHHDLLKESLSELFYCPLPHYSDSQWQIVNALFELLPIITAQLMLIFREKNQVDFIEMNSRALLALGEEETPTDLALYLDHRFQHILVDEFQDTSFSQFRLLKALTREWQPHSGKTLFLVGDPMQSIYRFRQAEVGLFLAAKYQGINRIKLTALVLTTNFRSDPTIVNWLNDNFSKIFPTVENIAVGAISFVPCIAQQNPVSHSEVNSHALINTSDEQQAEEIITTIINLQKNYPGETIAILMRTRLHLRTLVPILKQKQINFQGIKIDNLYEYPIIQDLLALTRALLHPADRIAWLSILRAPWCGLTLSDLHSIASKNHQLTIWQLLQQPEVDASLSTDGRLRIHRFINIISGCLAKREQQDFRIWLENTWRALGGPSCAGNSEALHCAKIFFDLIEKQELNFYLDLAEFENKIKDSHMPVQTGQISQLQIMTIHNAKGLEFDHVIIPYLERTPRRDEAQLLLWAERPNKNNQTDLILAPIKNPYVDYDEIYEYLKHEENKKQQYETTRLLYVATTRAKKSLHLFGNITAENSYQFNEPQERSFLHLLWPEIKHSFLEKLKHFDETLPVNQQTSSPAHLVLKRLKTDGFKNIIHPIPITHDAKLNLLQNIDNSARALGIVVHYWLQMIATVGLKHWDKQKIRQHQAIFEKQFIEHAVSDKEITTCVSTVINTLEKVLDDNRGQWILQEYEVAANELPLSFIVNNKIQHLVIDRTFVDANQQRWIIDYKTAAPRINESLESFLNQQFLFHRQQLELYAKAMKNFQPESIRLGLYFPSIAGWKEWSID